MSARFFSSPYISQRGMAKTLRSSVWKYFKLHDGDDSKALCEVCQDEGARVLISRGGKNSKKFTTMNLRNHLKAKHPKQFLELTDSDNEDRAVAEKRKEDKNDPTTATIRKKIKTQMSLQQSLEASRSWDINTWDMTLS